MIPIFPIVPTIASTIATTIASTLSSIATFISLYAPTILRTLETVNQVMSIISVNTQILQPKESLEDIGNRALQAAESQNIQPEQFNDYDDYLNEIRQFQLDPNKTIVYSSIDKQIAGLGIVCQSIEHKLNLPTNSMGILATMIALNPQYFTAERINHWLNTGSDLSQIIKYFNNDLGASDCLKTEQTLINLEKQNGSKSEFELETELEQAKADLQHSAQAHT